MIRKLLGAGTAVAAVGAAAALGGCGASRTVSGGVDPVARAAEVTARVPGYRISATTTVRTPAGTVGGTMAGVFDTAHRTGTFTSQESLAGRSLLMTEKVSGTTIYMRATGQPALQRLAGGKPWLSLDFSRAAGALGLQSLMSGNGNPAQFVDYLRAVGPGQTRVGSQTIAGVPATHYHVTVNLDRYPDLVPGSRRAAARTGITNLEAIIQRHTLPMDVWVDGHKLVRRISYSVPECIQNEHLLLGTAMTLSGYGPQPRPSLPAMSQTTDITPLLTTAMKNVKLACTSAA